MIRFAVVGLGHIGKRHVEVIQNNPDAELVALCDVRSLESLGIDDFGVPFFHSIDEMLESNVPIDVVNICAPNGFHAKYAIQALKKGCHVVIEKPMALTKSEAEQIVTTANEVSRNVFCVMQNRYSPPSVWLKQLMAEHRLGNIYMVQLNCFWNRDERYYTKGNWHGSAELDGGTLFTQFSHFVDVMNWLFGDITNIRGNFHDFSHQSFTEFEDSGVVTFDFVNGGMGSLNYSTSVWNKNLESSIVIIGEKGTVKVSGQYMNTVEYCHIKDYVLPEFARNAYDPMQNHRCLIQEVVEKLQENGPITTNVLDGLKVVDIIERIYQIRDQQWKK